VKPYRHDCRAEQPVIRQPDSGQWLQTPIEMRAGFEVVHLFALLDVHLPVVERISFRRSLKAFLDLGGEDRYLQFRPDHCSLTRAATNQALTEQGDSITSRIPRLYGNWPGVSMAIDAGATRNRRSLDLRLRAPGADLQCTPFLLKAIEREPVADHPCGDDVVQATTELREWKVFICARAGHGHPTQVLALAN
jgi:hypothetical protein